MLKRKASVVGVLAGVMMLGAGCVERFSMGYYEGEVARPTRAVFQEDLEAERAFGVESSQYARPPWTLTVVSDGDRDVAVWHISTGNLGPEEPVTIQHTLPPASAEWFWSELDGMDVMTMPHLGTKEFLMHGSRHYFDVRLRGRRHGFVAENVFMSPRVDDLPRELPERHRELFELVHWLLAEVSAQDPEAVPEVLRFERGRSMGPKR